MRQALPFLALIGTLIDPGGIRGEEKATEPLTDVGFVTQAVNHGLAEIALGKLAVARATDPEVKRLGELLAADYVRVNEELGRIAREAKFSIPESVTGGRQKDLEQFHGSTIKNFDAAYLARTVKDHRAAIELYMAASKQLKNERLRMFAEKTLPKLKDHAASAAKISDRLSKQ